MHSKTRGWINIFIDTFWGTLYQHSRLSKGLEKVLIETIKGPSQYKDVVQPV